MKTTSPEPETSYLNPNEAALLRCQTVLGLKDQGDYHGASRVMRPLWSGIGAVPTTRELKPPVAAEVCLCAGILTGWIGGNDGNRGAQEIARNLISECINFYQSTSELQQEANARAELAYCYWCEGAFDEGRIMFIEALRNLTAPGNSRARALVRLSVLESSASRFGESLRLLRENADLFSGLTNHSVKGEYHNQLANCLRNLATSEKRADYLEEAIEEYQRADQEFKLAHNVVCRADVQNNLALLLHKMLRFNEAHRYLDQARRLMVGIRDKVAVAQIDDTRAQVLTAEAKLEEAAALSDHVVRVLEKSGRQSLLADALITYGIALARLGKAEQARFTLQKAIDVAHQVGALNKAGLAALTMIEELADLPRETLHVAFHAASEWLADAQSEELLRRFVAASTKVFAGLNRKLTLAEAVAELGNKCCDLQTEMLRREGELIKQALSKTNGRITEAAAQLNMSHQALAYILEGRQRGLLKDRSPIRRRARKSEVADNRRGAPRRSCVKLERLPGKHLPPEPAV